MSSVLIVYDQGYPKNLELKLSNSVNIGMRFFDPTLMYLPKKGFPVPHLKWLTTVLQPLVKNGADRFNVKEYKLLDPETQWTLAALNILASEIKINLPIKVN